MMYQVLVKVDDRENEDVKAALRNYEWPKYCPDHKVDVVETRLTEMDFQIWYIPEEGDVIYFAEIENKFGPSGDFFKSLNKKTNLPGQIHLFEQIDRLKHSQAQFKILLISCSHGIITEEFSDPSINYLGLTENRRRQYWGATLSIHRDSQEILQIPTVNIADTLLFIEILIKKIGHKASGKYSHRPKKLSLEERNEQLLQDLFTDQIVIELRKLSISPLEAISSLKKAAPHFSKFGKLVGFRFPNNTVFYNRKIPHLGLKRLKTAIEILHGKPLAEIYPNFKENLIDPSRILNNNSGNISMSGNRI